VTTALSRSRPEDLLRCGAVLGRVAEQVSLASGRARRATALPWHGQAGSAYDVQLSSVARRLDALERAYDQACDVLVGYSRDLVVARDLAVHADALDEQADRERFSDVLVGALVPGLVDNAAAHAHRAAQLRAEAVDVEATAARRAAEALEQLMAEARGFTNTIASGIVGFGTMAGDAVLGLPFVGPGGSRQDHRDDLVSQAKAFVQPWLAVERFLEQWQEHHQSEAVGELGGMLLMKRTHAGSKEGARFGFLDEMHESVLRAVYRGSRAEVALDEQWLLHRAQARWDADIERLRHLPPATLDELLAGQVDLVHAEALGGHAIRKHVGRAGEFLRERQQTEMRSAQRPPLMSSFSDVDQAQLALRQALSQNVPLLQAFWSGRRPGLRISVPVSPEVGYVLGREAAWQGPRYAIVEIRRSAEHAPVIHTAFLHSQPAKESSN